MWNEFIVVDAHIINSGFKLSIYVDECIFYQGSTMFVLCTDDSSLAGSDQSEIDSIIEKLMTNAKLAILTVEGNLADFLGVNIE